MPGIVWGAVAAAGVCAAVLALRWALLSRRAFGSNDERNTYFVLETAEQAARAFQAGLTAASSARAIAPLRNLLNVPALAMCDGSGPLAEDGDIHDHVRRLRPRIDAVLASGRAEMTTTKQPRCSRPGCTLTSAVIAPVVVGDSVVGSLVACTATPTAALVRATEAVAGWVSVQLELSELHQSEARLAEAEVRFLRAQISPHFVYNAMTAIASFVRSDPNRARELLVDFADFTRHSFAVRGQFTTLSEELLSIERYLRLEHARYGDRLRIVLRIAPEVLNVAVPFLVLQPLVENAVRHGIGRKRGKGTVTIIADDEGGHCVVTVEDDGVGMDPDWLAEQFVRSGVHERVGLANVDERMRAIFGPECGLVVETAPGAGTKVIVSIPKFRAGVRAS